MRPARYLYSLFLKIRPSCLQNCIVCVSSPQENNKVFELDKATAASAKIYVGNCKCSSLLNVSSRLLIKKQQDTG
jgi:hypothetical protein